MKKLIQATGLFITLFLFAPLVHAQQQQNTEGMARLITNNMKSRLSLSDGQYQKAYAINLEFLNSSKAVKEKDLKKIDKMQALMVLEDERDVKMKAILTEKQFEQFLALNRENKEKLKKRQ